MSSLGTIASPSALPYSSSARDPENPSPRAQEDWVWAAHDSGVALSQIAVTRARSEMDARPHGGPCDDELSSALDLRSPSVSAIGRGKKVRTARRPDNASNISSGSTVTRPGWEGRRDNSEAVVITY
jgi:hypothetical protein